METEGSLPQSQQPASFPNAEPDRYSVELESTVFSILSDSKSSLTRHALLQCSMLLLKFVD
jgi:hypothetical protein